MWFWALFNIAVSLILYSWIKAPLVRAYLIVNYVLIVNPPLMWIFFGLSHPKFIPGDVNYSIALVFMVMFNIVLCSSFVILKKVLPKSRIAQRRVVGHRLNFSPHFNLLVFITLALALVGFVGKFGLNSAGAFRMNENNGGSAGPFLQLMKVFAGFDLFAIILLGEMRLASKKVRPSLNAALLFLLGLSLTFAIASGSRSQSVTILILSVLAYRDLVRRNWMIVYPSILAGAPSIFLLFPLLGYYRNNEFSFAEARYRLRESGLQVSEIFSDVIVTRLNYHEVLGRVVDYVSFHGPAGGSVYWNNIIGFIPRLIWPGKPQISNNSRELGHQLDLVTLDDQTTSIGLQVVGEAFYEYGWLGLWVAVFQAAIFALIHKNFFRPHNPAAMTVYSYATFYILQRDGYFAVVPGLIWLVIGFTCFFFTFRLFLPRLTRSTPNEALPYRFSH